MSWFMRNLTVRNVRRAFKEINAFEREGDYRPLMGMKGEGCDCLNKSRDSFYSANQSPSSSQFLSQAIRESRNVISDGKDFYHIGEIKVTEH